jgi:hypothetical protein|nr:MAG TPA: hypothetical protein [Crassvirales sp.]
MKKIIIPIGVLPIDYLDNENIIQTAYNDFIKFMQFNKLDPKDIIEKKYTIRIYSIISRIQFLIDNKEYLTKEQISYLTEYITAYKVNIKRYYEIICSHFDGMAEELIKENDNRFDEFTTEELMAEIERRNNK